MIQTKQHFIKILIWTLFIIYIGFLAFAILFKLRFYFFDYSSFLNIDPQKIMWKIKSGNFVPFRTIINYLFVSDLNSSIRLDNLIGNVIVFIPLGIFLPLLSTKFYSVKKGMFVGLTLSVFFELVQLIFAIGQFDVDDMILNVLGVYIGYTFWKLGIAFSKYLSKT